MTTSARSNPSVLMFGYSGANNTGAEALLQADIDDVRAMLGPHAHITIPSLNPANLRRYVKETPNLQIVRLPTLYFSTLHRLVRENDLIMLVEGSTYMDTWCSAMLWAYLWTTKCAYDMGKPVLAYAVDTGEIKSAFNRMLVRNVASLTSLIITRSAAAGDRLRTLGVTAPIQTTADNAFNFRMRPEDAALLSRLWPEAGSREGGARVVGMALVDFFQWPVVMKPWGRKEDCYKWPYFFARSPERTRATENLARSYAALADDMIARHGVSVALIGMEGLDESFLHRVHGLMTYPEAARVFPSNQYDASEMVSLLRSLDLLITSRYHACVLSQAALVPQIAVGHDLRLKTIYKEMSLFDDYFLEPDPQSLYAALRPRVEQLLADPACVADRLQHSYKQHLNDARRNRALLADFIKAYGLAAAPKTTIQSTAAA